MLAAAIPAGAEMVNAGARRTLTLARTGSVRKRERVRTPVGETGIGAGNQMVMVPQDAYELELDSDRFLLLCANLNATVRRDDAAWTVDVLSGGFTFSDEIPDGSNESMDLFLPLITMLRRLWAHRVSLVEGKPRQDLAPTWESARRWAPQWAGFTPDRWSSTMRPILDEVKSRDEQFARDIEGLEAGIAMRGELAGIVVANGEIAGIENCPIDTRRRG